MENNKIGEARAINSDLPFFKNQFIMPVKGIISGVYGSQRILNGKPRWPHYGIDIAAKKGTMIKSSRYMFWPHSAHNWSFSSWNFYHTL